jgi:hypothetical protein
MASVFGFYTVEESIPQANNSFLIKAYDEDWDKHVEIKSNKHLPEGTRIYWEHFYRTGEFYMSVVN